MVLAVPFDPIIGHLCDIYLIPLASATDGDRGGGRHIPVVQGGIGAASAPRVGVRSTLPRGGCLVPRTSQSVGHDGYGLTRRVQASQTQASLYDL